MAAKSPRELDMMQHLVAIKSEPPGCQEIPMLDPTIIVSTLSVSVRLIEGLEMQHQLWGGKLRWYESNLLSGSIGSCSSVPRDRAGATGAASELHKPIKAALPTRLETASRARFIHSAAVVDCHC